MSFIERFVSNPPAACIYVLTTMPGLAQPYHTPATPHWKVKLCRAAWIKTKPQRSFDLWARMDRDGAPCGSAR